jgi:hypothetical protein
MFRKQTVFIIGAGAGADIDMCMGSVLIDEIARDVDFFFEAGELKRGNFAVWEAARRTVKTKEEANALLAAGRRISVGICSSGSIDNYIHHHRNDPAIKTVGKIAIGNTILTYERKSKLFPERDVFPSRFRDRTGTEQSWLHSFFRLLGEGLVVGETLDSIFDNVSVLTFNYDRCFEQYLWKSLQDRFSIGEDEATKLMSKLRIHHPYGKLGHLPWEGSDGLSFGAEPRTTDLAELAKNIRTYNEEVQQDKKLDEALGWVSSALTLVFLGFHFHDQNVELIKHRPSKEGRATTRHAYATAVYRSGPEREIIREQIKEIVGGPPPHVESVADPIDCKTLFSTYGTTFTRK